MIYSFLFIYCDCILLQTKLSFGKIVDEFSTIKVNGYMAIINWLKTGQSIKSACAGD